MHACTQASTMMARRKLRRQKHVSAVQSNEKTARILDSSNPSSVSPSIILNRVVILLEVSWNSADVCKFSNNPTSACLCGCTSTCKVLSKSDQGDAQKGNTDTKQQHKEVKEVVKRVPQSPAEKCNARMGLSCQEDLNQ